MGRGSRAALPCPSRPSAAGDGRRPRGLCLPLLLHGVPERPADANDEPEGLRPGQQGAEDEHAEDDGEVDTTHQPMRPALPPACKPVLFTISSVLFIAIILLPLYLEEHGFRSFQFHHHPAFRGAIEGYRGGAQFMHPDLDLALRAVDGNQWTVCCYNFGLINEPLLQQWQRRRP